MGTLRRPTVDDRGPEKRRSRRVITSLELMGDGSELIIVHAGEEYRLSITKQAKLILTK